MRDLYKQACLAGRPVEPCKELIHFHGVDGYTVYNATPPVWLSVFGKTENIIAGRVEKFDEWARSYVCFFRRIDDHNYNLVEEIPPIIGESPLISIEDPSITIVSDEIILSVVRAIPLANNKHDVNTLFYRGKDLCNLKQFAIVEGKDNRICPVENGKIVWMPRPKGFFGGLGNIGYCELSSVNDLANARWKDAKLIKGLFSKGSWGGVNEIHFNPTNPSIIGALCHGAFQDSLGKVYFIFWVNINRSTRKIVDLITLAIRDDLPSTNAKLPELKRVIFGTGIQYSESRAPRLYCGVSDAYQGYVSVTHSKIVNFYSS